jgi:peptidoglycan/LPS O-acetylase OafA/YrhL
VRESTPASAPRGGGWYEDEVFMPSTQRVAVTPLTATDRSTAPPLPDVAFRPDIEGLRALAILLVVAYHIDFPGLRGGFIGVDVFFVISGYLITGLLLERPDGTRLSLMEFYARRTRRLLPASVLTLAFIVIAGWLLLSPAERQYQARAAAASALYVSNLWLQRQTADYFAPESADNPVLHTWSLAVEEQFYLVWPLMLALAFTRATPRRWIASALISVAGLSLLTCLWLSTVDQLWAYFSLATRAWEFVLGAAAVVALPMLRPWLNRSAWPLGGAGLLAILASALWLDVKVAFPSAATLVPVIGTVAVLLAGARDSPNKQPGVRLLASAPMQRLGRLSYSWYLWHWPILFFGGVLSSALTASLAGRIALVICALGVAAVSYRWIENPIRFSAHLRTRPVHTLVLAAMLTLVAAGGSRYALAVAEVAANTPEQQAILRASFGSPRRLQDSGCFLDYDRVTLPECNFGNPEAASSIVLFGDSHAAQWFSALESIARDQDWRLVPFTKAGCPSAQVNVELWTLQRAYPECMAWRQAALRRIIELHPKVVVIANSDAHVSARTAKGPRRLTAQQWRDGMRMTLELLSAAGIRVVVLRDTPGARYDVMRCLSRQAASGRSSDACGSLREERVRNDVVAQVRDAAQGLPSVNVLDLTDKLCDQRTCPPVINGVIVYRDAGHINDTFAASLADDFKKRLTAFTLQGGV